MMQVRYFSSTQVLGTQALTTLDKAWHIQRISIRCLYQDLFLRKVLFLQSDMLRHLDWLL